MNPKNAIELRDISLTYSYKYQDNEITGILGKPKKKTFENHVLDHIDLDVKKGEILGIIGVNGAGKSTLLKIMARILDPDSGTVETNGKVATILELGMGFHNDLSGRENIVLKGELYGFTKKEMQSKIDEIITYSGLRKYIDNPIRTYSSGMRSRLAFSIMVHVDAEIMLVDEILSTGDASFSIKAKDYFKKILKDGKTVVYVSHSPGSVESICNRAIWLKDGKIVADGSPKKISAMYLEATTESFDIVKDQAESGLSTAQLNLAHFYKDGNSIEKNEQLYEEWLRKAADQGLIEAQIEYADILIKRDLDESKQEALTYYQIAADAGNDEARFKLAYIIGQNNNADYYQIRKIFEEYSKSDNPNRIFMYASFLLNTATNEEDKKEAFNHFKYLADKYSHPDAIIILCKMYLRGIGVQKNIKEYISLLQKGSSIGITDSMFQMANLLMAGVYVDKNEKEAFKLYMNCAKNGFGKSQYIVANMYNTGTGVERDVNKSKEWYQIYYKTQLATYQLQAIELLKNSRNDEQMINELYSKIEQSYNIKALLNVVRHYDLDENSHDISAILDTLSHIYGKPMMTAFKHYNNANSTYYSPEKTFKLCQNMKYLGNPKIDETLSKLQNNLNGE